jgi:AcrR family transcriptional regulator
MGDAAAQPVMGGGRRGRPTADDTRKRMTILLRVAREHFVRNGYRDTTMAEVAAAAGLTKRTLYQWHGDKGGLFRACVLDGAERFPLPGIDSSKDMESALNEYSVALLRELAAEDSFGMGLLFLREGPDFPELGAAIGRVHSDFVIDPLARYLRDHGLEDEGSVERALLFIALVLSPVHHHLLVGRPIPSPPEITKHVLRAVSLFLDGARRSVDHANARGCAA